MLKWVKIFLLLLLAASATGASLNNSPPLIISPELDTDGDGISDEEEYRLYLSPFDPSDGLADEDGDGLTLGEELRAGTDPFSADSDSDGYTDREEIMLGTNPNNPQDPPKKSPTGTAPTTTLLTRQPVNLMRNGDFSAGLKFTRSGASGFFAGPFRWDYQAAGKVNGWSAYRGTQIETWQCKGNQFIELDAAKGHFGIKQKLTTLKAGGYLLHWNQCGRKATQAGANAYFVNVVDNSGAELARINIPSTGTSNWSLATLAFQITATQAAEGVTVNFVPLANTTYGCLIDNVSLVSAMLEVDYDRNGTISAGEAPPVGKPWRLWINDDLDEGDYQENDADVPGRPMKWFTESSQPDRPTVPTAHYNNFAQRGIQGQRDLVDFFPLNLAIAEVLRILPTTDGYRYRIKQPEWAVNIVLTGLKPSEVRRLYTHTELKIFGEDWSSGVDKADVLTLDDAGNVELPEAWLQRIEQVGHGVILLEGRGGARGPLELQVTKGGTVVTSIPLKIAVDTVEHMYRQIDLTRVCTSTDGFTTLKPPGEAQPTQTAEPIGLPDSESSDRWIVFVHGYNVDCEKARGWQAETFKRLYATGSKARFVGVTWYGDTGLDYHKAVFHSFQTGDKLIPALHFLDISDTTFVGHSLGNMVVSHALQETKVRPHRYLMVNAAVASEAYGNGSSEQSAEMVEQFWRVYNSRFYSTHWHRLPFPAGDRRQYLTWKDRFVGVSQGRYVSNYYSRGDEVVTCPTDLVNASLWEVMSRFGDGAWKTQELLKGNRSIPAFAMSELQGGWGVEGYWGIKTPEYAESNLRGEHLIGAPLFTFFHPAALHYYVGMLHQTEWALNRKNTWYDLLARGLPATSYAAGGVPILIPKAGEPVLISNYNLEDVGRRYLADRVTPYWPSQGHNEANTKGRWKHSDLKNVALPYVHPFFQSVIELSR